MINNLLIVLVISFAIYFLIDILFLRKKSKRFIYRARLVNVLFVLGILSGFYITITQMTLYIFLQIFLLNIAELCVLALATTGIVLIFKTSVTTNFAQGTMATFGAFFAAKLLLYLTRFVDMSMTLKLILALCASAFVAFLIGLFIDVVIIRNGKNVNSIGKQMITMGLVLLLLGLMPLVYGLIPLTVEAFSYDVKIFTLGEMTLILPDHNYYSLIITVAILLVLFISLRFTKWGLGVRATASNEIVAGMMGVNTRIITAMSWGIAGALGGVAAFLYAPVGSQVSVSYMVPVQVNAFLASVLGGFSTFGGPLVGVVLINLFQSMASFFNSVWSNVIVYTLVLILVLAKPFGLFGKRTAKKV